MKNNNMLDVKSFVKNQQKIVNAIRNSKGRFFSLKTRSGELLNAQFVRETDQYIIVNDRNTYLTRKFAKSNLSKFKMGQVEVAV